MNTLVIIASIFLIFALIGQIGLIVTALPWDSYIQDTIDKVNKSFGYFTLGSIALVVICVIFIILGV